MFYEGNNLGLREKLPKTGPGALKTQASGTLFEPATKPIDIKNINIRNRLKRIYMRLGPKRVLDGVGVD
jgi:hypothetical protein